MQQALDGNKVAKCQQSERGRCLKMQRNLADVRGQNGAIGASLFIGTILARVTWRWLGFNLELDGFSVTELGYQFVSLALDIVSEVGSRFFFHKKMVQKRLKQLNPKLHKRKRNQSTNVAAVCSGADPISQQKPKKDIFEQKPPCRAYIFIIVYDR